MPDFQPPEPPDPPDPNSDDNNKKGNDSSEDLPISDRRWFLLKSPEEIWTAKDYRLPNKHMRIIEVDEKPFFGRWLSQYFDLAAGFRYSLGETPDHKFFVLRLNESTRDITLLRFETWQAVCESELPTELKHPMDLIL